MAVRFERLDLNPWGCFHALSLSFSPTAGMVDLIYGPNASGKSTTNRGARSLLYGIEERTPDNHSFDYADLRIGALLQLDGESVELARRKRRVGSLVGPDDKQLPDDLITAALGGLGEGVYAALFQIDHDTLVEGGAELLQGQGEVGASLFAAAAGIATLHGTLARFEAQAEGVFKPRGRKSSLHLAREDLQAAERRLRAHTLRPARQRELARAVDNDEQSCAGISHRIRELEQRVRELELRRAVAPLIARHRQLSAAAADLADTPELDPDAASRRADAQGRARLSAQQIARIEHRLAKLDEESEAISLDERLLIYAGEIRMVHEALPVVRKAAGDRRKREGEHQEAATLLARAATTAGTGPDELASLRRPATARRTLDDCLREYERLLTRSETAAATLRDAAAARDHAREELAAVAPAPDVRALASATNAALKAGALPARQDELVLQATRKRRRAEEALQRLSPAPATIEQLRVLAAPTREQAEHGASRAAELEQARRDLQADCDRYSEERRALAQARRQLDLTGAAPTTEELASARDERDDRWSTLRAALLAGSATAPDDADGFEQAVTAADRLADTRTDRAALLERSAQLASQAHSLALEHATLSERRGKLDSDREQLTTHWGGRWAVTGLSQVAPEDAPAFLAACDQVLALDQAASETEAEAETIQREVRRHSQALRGWLAELGHDGTDAAELDQLIERAQAVLEDARTTAAVRAGLEAELRGLERAADTAERESGDTAAALKQWRADWPDRCSAAGLPGATTPAAAQEVARAIDEGLSQLARIGDLTRRIEGIDRDCSEFERRVTGLCETVAPDLSALDPERAAAELEARRERERSERARRDNLAEQRSEAEAEREAAEAELHAAQAEVEALLATAGCEQVEQLPEVERRSAHVRALRAELAQVEQQATEIGEGTFEELARDCEGFDRAAAAERIAELQEEVERLDTDRDELKEQIGERKRVLAAAETDTTAVEAAEDVELARTRIIELAREYAVARLSGAVMRRAIERYRRQHQDPLLRRANELFGRFTLGSFVELFVDVDDRGRAQLVGRQRDRKRILVPAMSSGTREQLFLALRLAAIERYIATSGPVPVIFDDVFLESDEPRSERIFEALGELAVKTQVIVLTHHRHLITLGQRVLGDRVIVQELPDAAPSLRAATAAA
jgi:uncharacterized protein YhaN